MNPEGRWKILVVDDHAQKLLGSVLKHFDILEENVTREFLVWHFAFRAVLMSLGAVIESISSYREQQQFEAVYMLMPTTQNVDRIIRDFSDGRQQYLKAHLFFLDGTHPRSYRKSGCSFESHLSSP